MALITCFGFYNYLIMAGSIYVILKALPQVCMEYTAQSECRVANIAQGKAECYICHNECCIFHTKEVAVL